jgi:hypothetical protein
MEMLLAGHAGSATGPKGEPVQSPAMRSIGAT